jgi:CDP-diglyceride synthetase
MKRVLTAVVLVPLVLLAVFRAPLWLFALLVAAIIVLALREYLAIAEAAGTKPFRWLTYAVSMIPIITVWVAIVIALQASIPRRYAIYPVDLPALEPHWCLGKIFVRAWLPWPYPLLEYCMLAVPYPG